MGLTTQERLLREARALEDAIEDAGFAETWTYADWLAEHVPSQGHGGDRSKATRVALNLRDIEIQSRYGLAWLKQMRATATATAPDRLPDVSLRAYAEALRNTGNDLAKANKSLAAKGKRLRDQAGPMESMDAIKRQLAKRSAGERASLAADLVSDDAVVDAAYNDEDARLRLDRASARLHSRDTRRDDERERVRRQMTEDQQRWEKFQRLIRAGEFGPADWQSTKFEVTDERAEWLRDRAEYLRKVATWLEAIASHETVTDEALQRLLGG
jgi:hypothetical protein